MIIDEKDFISFISIKQNLAKSSIDNCIIRVRVINRWFSDKELTKENIEKFFLDLKDRGKKNNTLNTYYFVFRQLLEYYRDRGLKVDFLDGFKSFKKTKPDIIIFTKEEIEEVQDLRGLVASTGKAIGTARILMSAKEVSKIKQGDILIAVMTRPDYVPAMKKAGAIVTDEGGITSHAAIVARELGLPCIIGTKIATKMFKDDNMLEVDAKHNLARKLKIN